MPNPFCCSTAWFKEAEAKEPNDANAMGLATVGPDGMPSLRMVLLKGVDERGFVFYTNYESRKGQQLMAHRKAALTFHWKSLRRSVRIEGDVELTTPEEADAYFATRPRSSQIGAWASDQSRPLESRYALETRDRQAHRQICHRRRAAAAALVGLSRRAAGGSSSGRTGPFACMTARSISARARAGR